MKTYILSANKKMLSGNLKDLILPWRVNYPTLELALEAAQALSKQDSDGQDSCVYIDLRIIYADIKQDGP